MMEGELVPMMLLTAGLMGGLGGVGWCWRIASRHAWRRHARREAAAQAAGWHYEPTEHGFALAGRTLSCGWRLRSSSHGGVQAALFSLGAPDERRAMLALGTGTPTGVLQHLQPWPADGSALQGRVWIEAATPEDARRVLDAQTRALIADWVAPRAGGGGRGLHAWISPHGVQIACPHGLRDWSEVEPLVRLGVALGHCAGLA